MVISLVYDPTTKRLQGLATGDHTCSSKCEELAVVVEADGSLAVTSTSTRGAGGGRRWRLRRQRACAILAVDL